MSRIQYLKNKMFVIKPKMIIYSIIGVFLIILGVLFLVSGAFLQKSYLDPWHRDYYKRFEDPRIQVVSHGLLAPNAHNLQSWRIVLDPKDSLKFKLYLNENRLLPETDPYHRQLIISHGTFLELVNIAAKELDYTASITVFPVGEFGLSPSPEIIHNTPTAEIKLIENNPEEDDLYDSIFDRVTARTEYLETSLTKEQIDEITSLNTDPDIQVFVFQGKEELDYIKNLAIWGTKIESELERTMQESNKVLRYNEYQKNKYAYGLTLSSQGWPKFKQFLLESISTIFPLSIKEEGKVWLDGETIKIQKTPAYIMIVSTKNDRATQVAVGRLYSRIQLSGTELGLSMQPTSQVLQEFPEMAKLYNRTNEKLTKNGETVQMLFRVGESKTKVEHSPRMNPEKLLEN